MQIERKDENISMNKKTFKHDRILLINKYRMWHTKLMSDIG